MSRGKLRWGDTLDDEDLLPPSVVKGPDDNGIKTLVEYFKNDKGDVIKKTTKVKVVTMEKKVYKVSEERRKWPRFGLAARETPQDSFTAQAVDEIPFERVRQIKATTQEKKATDIQQVLASADKTVISGSIKEMLYKKRMERELLRMKGLLKEAEKPPEEDGKPSIPGLGGPKPGSYVPPNVRNRGPGGDGESMQKKREDNSIRVTNLSEEVTEADLQELFRPFGPVSRIFLAVDKQTGENRGFAFVNYVHREDAERAIRNLNGFGYDNLILRVEWAQPREK
ncbi:hypothetical protein VaNZ11_015094 [Volvox africanus]|uniref:Eukaryotic translation initiation factor 3 subunit G n=1 Tax=Volvox africanus TaxID=51714 RepID=A0ABQ5SJS7_9CHLO|nr:hypothetical protein VaNZ11_015094 [Volvox africanus]